MRGVTWICTGEAPSRSDDPEKNAGVVDLKMMRKRRKSRAKGATYVVEAHDTHTVVLLKTMVPEAADELSDLRPNLGSSERACWINGINV